MKPSLICWILSNSVFRQSIKLSITRWSPLLSQVLPLTHWSEWQGGIKLKTGMYFLFSQEKILGWKIKKIVAVISISFLQIVWLVSLLYLSDWALRQAKGEDICLYFRFRVMMINCLGLGRRRKTMKIFSIYCSNFIHP